MNKFEDLKENESLPKTKAELALRYNPKTTPKNAVQILRRWIEKHPNLSSDLKQANYNQRGHLVTPCQVRIIYKYLGNP